MKKKITEKPKQNQVSTVKLQLKQKKKGTQISQSKKPLEKNLVNVSMTNDNIPEEETIQKPFNFVSAPKKLVPVKQVSSGVKALFQYIKATGNTDKALFDDEKPVFLQITSIKVPITPARIVRLTLPHTLLLDSSEICLIVKDIDKPKEHEETIEHFEDILSKHEISNIKTILPYHQFKTEYGGEFELQRNLLGLYDCFLVDSKVSSYVSKVLGKIFMEKRKTPLPIKMDVPYLKSHIEKTLRKTPLQIHSKSDSFIIQIGHTKMNQSHISENIMEVIDQLCNEFPGGSDNIRALSVKTDKSIAVPIYLTLKNKNDVLVPVIRSKRPKHFKEVSGELSTLLNKEVTVLPSGKIFVKSVGSSDEELEESEDEAN